MGILNPELLSDNTTIWRYINLPKLISLFQKQSLWFSRLDILTDEYEGEIPENDQAEILLDMFFNNSAQSEHDILNDFKSLNNRISEFKKFTLVNSWTISESESFALWKIYLENSPYGLAIKSSFGLLKQSLSESDDEIQAFSINYIDSLTGHLGNPEHDKLISYKYDFYQYEKELRLAIKYQLIKDDPNDGPKPIYTRGKYVHINPSILIQSIITPPKAEVWYDEIIGNLIKKYKIQTKIERSYIRDKI